MFHFNGKFLYKLQVDRDDNQYQVEDLVNQSEKLPYTSCISQATGYWDAPVAWRYGHPPRKSFFFLLRF